MQAECPDCGKPNPKSKCRWCGWSPKEAVPVGESLYRFVRCGGQIPVLDGSQFAPCTTMLRELAQGPIRPFLCRECRARESQIGHA